MPPLFNDCFFVCYKFKGQECRIQVQSKKAANVLFATLKDSHNAELIRVRNGLMTKIA